MLYKVDYRNQTNRRGGLKYSSTIKVSMRAIGLVFLRITANALARRKQVHGAASRSVRFFAKTLGLSQQALSPICPGPSEAVWKILVPLVDPHTDIKPYTVCNYSATCHTRSDRQSDVPWPEGPTVLFRSITFVLLFSVQPALGFSISFSAIITNHGTHDP